MADPTPAAAPEAAAPKKKSSKLLIIIAAAVVAIGAAGAGAYFFLGRADHDTETAEADEEQAEGDEKEAADHAKDSKSSKGSKEGKDGKDGKGKKGKKAAPKGPPIYVKFDPPFVVNFEAKGVMRFLQVSLEVMTRDASTAELIKQHDPMLRNDLLLLFSSQTYETISTLEGKERLRGEAQQAIAKVIEAEGGAGKNVEQIYFTSFVMQ